MTREKFYPRGSVILFENDPGDSLFVVRQGRGKGVRIGEDGREVTLRVLGVAEHFCALRGGPRAPPARGGHGEKHQEKAPPPQQVSKEVRGGPRDGLARDEGFP